MPRKEYAWRISPPAPELKALVAPACAGRELAYAKMYYVYIIKSLRRNWFYVGLTSNIDNRLLQHNKGATKSTKAYKPFKIIYNRAFVDRIAARDFEKFLKIHSNKEKLLKRLSSLF